MPDTQVQTSKLKNKRDMINQTASFRSPCVSECVITNVFLFSVKISVDIQMLPISRHEPAFNNLLWITQFSSTLAAHQKPARTSTWAKIKKYDRARVKHRPSSPWGRTDRKARPGPSLVTTVAPYFCAVAEQVGLSRKSGGNYTLEEKSKRQSLS